MVECKASIPGTTFATALSPSNIPVSAIAGTDALVNNLGVILKGISIIGGGESRVFAARKPAARALRSAASNHLFATLPGDLTTRFCSPIRRLRSVGWTAVRDAAGGAPTPMAFSRDSMSRAASCMRGR